MKQVYILRHGPVDKPGQLTEEGKEKIKAIKNIFGNFQIIIASEIARAQETAFLLTDISPKIDKRANVIPVTQEESEELYTLGKKHTMGVAGVVFEHEKFRQMAQKQGEKLVNLIKEILNRLEEGEKALIISHDSSMAAAERLLKGLPLDKIDRNYKPLEGFVVNDVFEVLDLS